jgi:hypothetical protein
MANSETDLEKTQLKAAGLERWFRARLLNGLTRLLIALFVFGGIVTTLTPHMLLTASICASVGAVIAVVMTVRISLILRELRNRPEQAVARLTKWRKLKRAGYAPGA